MTQHQQTQQQHQTFLNPNKKPEPITKKHQFQKPRPTIGRPNERISADQLKKAEQIITWNIARQGKIGKWQCPLHQQKNLSYDISPDGARVFCEVPGCTWTTHSELTNHHGNGNTQNLGIIYHTQICKICGLELTEEDPYYVCSQCGITFCKDCGYSDVYICDSCIKKTRKETQ